MPAIEEPRAVDVAKIERELLKIWTDAAQDPESGSMQRSCAFNLVVLTPGERAENFFDVLHEVTGHHPCRAICIGSPAESRAVTATASAHCAPGGGGAHVCGEQIVLDAPAGSFDLVPSIVGPLLLADMPVVLWCNGSPAQAPELFQHLASLADRIVVDSNHAPEPLAAVRDVDDMMRSHGRHAAVSDLAWARLTPVRQLLAQFFDTPETLDALARIERIEIGFAHSGSQAPPEAWLLLGWLASRLGWSVGAAGRSATADASDAGGSSKGMAGTETGDTETVETVVFRAGERTVTARLRPVEARHPGVRLASVLLATGEPAYTFSLCRTGGAGCVETTARTADGRTVRRVAQAQPATLAQLLVDELRILSRDALYEEALHAAAAMIRAVLPAASNAA